MLLDRLHALDTVVADRVRRLVGPGGKATLWLSQRSWIFVVGSTLAVTGLVAGLALSLGGGLYPAVALSVILVAPFTLAVTAGVVAGCSESVRRRSPEG